MTKEKEFLKKMEEFIKAYGKDNNLEITAVITVSSKDNDKVQLRITGVNMTLKDVMKRTSESIIEMVEEILK